MDPKYYSPTAWPESYSNMMMQNAMMGVSGSGGGYGSSSGSSWGSSDIEKGGRY